MTVLSAAREGWKAVREAVWERQGRMCAAVSWRIFGKDAADDPCRSEFGHRIEPHAYAFMEFDHVKEEVGGRKAADDEAHGIMVCPWHHRLSQRWRSDSSAHRFQERVWLAEQFPEVWDAGS